MKQGTLDSVFNVMANDPGYHRAVQPSSSSNIFAESQPDQTAAPNTFLEAMGVSIPPVVSNIQTLAVNPNAGNVAATVQQSAMPLAAMQSSVTDAQNQIRDAIRAMKAEVSAVIHQQGASSAYIDTRMAHNNALPIPIMAGPAALPGMLADFSSLAADMRAGGGDGLSAEQLRARIDAILAGGRGTSRGGIAAGYNAENPSLSASTAIPLKFDYAAAQEVLGPDRSISEFIMSLDPDNPEALLEFQMLSDQAAEIADVTENNATIQDEIDSGIRWTVAEEALTGVSKIDHTVCMEYSMFDIDGLKISSASAASPAALNTSVKEIAAALPKEPDPAAELLHLEPDPRKLLSMAMS